MLDRYRRKINYLRVSVTDRCNLRCKYCMPEKGIPLLSHEDILSYEEIAEVVKTSVQFGINKVRLTGGEPLIRKGIVNLVSLLSRIEGIEDLSMTTNGILLAEYAERLKEEGLDRVNISLDSLNPDKFKEMTCGGNLEDVLKGIERAKKAGLNPIKINCVVNSSSDEENAIEVRKFANENGLIPRFIKKMSLNHGDFAIVDGGTGGDCNICNRLRLTSDGKIRPCLFSEITYDVRRLGAKEALSRAIVNKPEKGTHNKTGEFYNIGG